MRSDMTTARDLVEACYRSLTLDDWIRQVSDAARAYFADPLAIGIVGYGITAQPKASKVSVEWARLNLGSSVSDADFARGVFEEMQRAGNSVALAQGQGIPTVQTLDQLTPIERQVALRETPSGSQDMLNLLGGFYDSGVMLCSVLPRQSTSRERRQGRFLAEHLSVGYELVLQQARGSIPSVARFKPDGRCLDASGVSKPARLRLTQAVRNLDSVRCSRRRLAEADVTREWTALVDGEYAILEQSESGGTATVIAVSLESLGMQRLTERELDVARLAARGLSNKAIGAELGLAVGTVSVHLLGALRKLGIANRKALARFPLPGLKDRVEQ